MAEIHVEIGTHGTTLDYPVQIEDSLLEHIQTGVVILGGAATAPEDSEGEPGNKSILIEEGADELVSAVDSWFREQEITPERTSDGVGNFHWEFDLP